MIVLFLIIIIVMLAVHIPKNNAKSILVKEFKPLFEKRLEDPLLPPERTYPNNRINIRTQGPEQNYQQVGFLFQESNGIRLALYGRPEYSGSTKWEYYVKTSTNDGNIKIPLDNTKELYTGDIVNIQSYNGDFISEIYDIDQPKYIPNIL